MADENSNPARPVLAHSTQPRVRSRQALGNASNLAYGPSTYYSPSYRAAPSQGLGNNPDFHKDDASKLKSQSKKRKSTEFQRDDPAQDAWKIPARRYMGKQVGRLPVAVAPYFELVTVKDFVPPRPVPEFLVPKPVQPAITALGDSSFAGSRNLINPPVKDLDVLAFYSHDMPLPTPAVIFPFLDEGQGSFQTLDDIDLFLWNKRQKKGGSSADSVAKDLEEAERLRRLRRLKMEDNALKRQQDNSQRPTSEPKSGQGSSKPKKKARSERAIVFPLPKEIDII
ncbi:hypothetical protein EXIGLDRAFT_722589 [Exidia glandulosa HHB12029]|uniref:Uncharacterized protein n=1 Tax=Exidia glandulosa HHB12029 TaxID=1314781 RepID=A0A165F7V0_EXIGL|nr:hypothetical protein EXIGLDRAFT_722589 [Exidia glandulosa HHB12029]